MILPSLIIIEDYNISIKTFKVQPLKSYQSPRSMSNNNYKTEQISRIMKNKGFSVFVPTLLSIIKPLSTYIQRQFKSSKLLRIMKNKGA